MNFTDYFLLYGRNWLIDLVLMVAVLAVIIYNWKRFVRFSVTNMLLIAVAVWLFGMGLYAVGLTYEGTGHNLMSILLRSALASIKMFIADNELIEISEYYKSDPLYMALFAMIHFLAFCLAAILVLNTIGTRFVSYAALMKERMTCRRTARHSHVFWGINSPSLALAADIRRHDSESRIVFICPYSASSIGEKLEVTQILSSTTMSHEVTGAEVDEIESVITVHIPKISMQSKRMEWLKTILESSSDVDFYFFTDDSLANIRLAETVPNGFHLTLKEGSNMGIHVLTNAASSRQKVAEEHLILHGAEDKRVHWSFVDIPSTAVESLKFGIQNYPVSTFPAEAIKEGRVDGEFNSWVLGLGESGSEMFKFMYEFSTLESTASSVQDSRIIKRNFLLFDKEADTKGGDILKGCPELLSSGEISMSSVSVGCDRFWDMLRSSADSLNCISIALGNDENDLKLARDIYRHLLHFARNPKLHTKIFVRVYSQDYLEMFNTLAKDYNSEHLQIIPFGGIKELFTTDLILKKGILNTFKAFNHHFDMVRGKNPGLTADQCWRKDFDIAKYTSSYSNVAVALDELERRKAQCFSSTFHIGTLLALAGIDAADKAGIERLLQMVETADGMSEGLVDTLIRSCFLREQASHRLLGFTSCSNEYVKQNRTEAVTRKLTPYLLPWGEATEKTRIMFRDILKTSLGIAAKRIEG